MRKPSHNAQPFRLTQTRPKANAIYLTIDLAKNFSCNQIIIKKIEPFKPLRRLMAVSQKGLVSQQAESGRRVIKALGIQIYFYRLRTFFGDLNI